MNAMLSNQPQLGPTAAACDEWAICPNKTVFNTGLEEVGHNLLYVMSLGPEIPRDRCLDFGCGVGRLTQALCDYFDRCDGVDIAASMVEGARSFNQHGIRCHYHVNSTGDL